MAEQRRVRDHARKSIVEFDVDRDRPRTECHRSTVHHLVEADLVDVQVHRARLDPAHVEEVRDERVEPVGTLFDRGEQLLLDVRGPVEARLTQARHGGLDRCQRSTEVVGDGCEQRGAEFVCCLHRLRSGAAGPQQSLFYGDRQLVEEGDRGRPVHHPERAIGQQQATSRPGVEHPIGVGRRGRRM